MSDFVDIQQRCLEAFGNRSEKPKKASVKVLRELHKEFTTLYKQKYLPEVRDEVKPFIKVMPLSLDQMQFNGNKNYQWAAIAIRLDVYKYAKYRQRPTQNVRDEMLSELRQAAKISECISEMKPKLLYGDGYTYSITTAFDPMYNKSFAIVILY